MKIRPVLFVALAVVSIVSCRNKESETERGLPPEPNVEVATIDTSACELDKFLDRPDIPQHAKDLYNNTAKNHDDTISYFEQLEDTEAETRACYFKVITNINKVADGATGEGLGASGKNYVETNTPAFAAYFDNTACFTDADLETWVNIVMHEIRLVYDNIPDASDKDTFTATLKANCKDCTPSQKATINKFCTLLEKRIVTM